MEIASPILRTVKAGNRFATVWSKILCLSLKRSFVLFESLLMKIKNDLMKFLLNLNIVVSNAEKKKTTK